MSTSPSIFNGLNAQKLIKFNKYIEVYKNLGKEMDNNFDQVFTATISNLLFILKSFLLLVEYNTEEKKIEEISIIDQQRMEQHVNKKLKSTLLQKQSLQTINDITKDLPQESKTVIDKYVPTIMSNVKNSILNDYINKQKSMMSTSTVKNKMKQRLVAIQNDIGQKLNDINYNYDYYMYIKLIEVVVLFYTYLKDIDNYKQDDSTFLNKDEKIQVSNQMKEKFNEIAFQSKQKQKKLMNDISRFVVTGLKEKNII